MERYVPVSLEQSLYYQCTATELIYACYFSTWKWLLLYVIGVSFRNKKDMLENLKIILL